MKVATSPLCSGKWHDEKRQKRPNRDTPTREQWQCVCKWMEQYRTAMCAAAAPYADRYCDSEDIVHDAMIAAVRQLQRGTTVRTPRSWLIGVTKKVGCAQVTRRKTRAALRLEKSLYLTARDAPDPLETYARSDWVRRAIATLPGPQQRIIWYIYADDLPVARIAALLDMPSETIRVYHHRARNRLRQLLQQPVA